MMCVCVLYSLMCVCVWMCCWIDEILCVYMLCVFVDVCVFWSVCVSVVCVCGGKFCCGCVMLNVLLCVGVCVGVGIVCVVVMDGVDVVNVDLGDWLYLIYVGMGLLDDGDALRAYVAGSTAFVVTNEIIVGFGYFDCMVKVFMVKDLKLCVEMVVLLDGEEYKNLEVLNAVYTRALETRFDRGTTFVALGGGVIGDMMGYVVVLY